MSKTHFISNTCRQKFINDEPFFETAVIDDENIVNFSLGKNIEDAVGIMGNIMDYKENGNAKASTL